MIAEEERQRVAVVMVVVVVERFEWMDGGRGMIQMTSGGGGDVVERGTEDGRLVEEMIDGAQGTAACVVR